MSIRALCACTIVTYNLIFMSLGLSVMTPLIFDNNLGCFLLEFTLFTYSGVDYDGSATL